MNQRIALTKKLLKNSLTEMLKTKSIYKISIRELCENAGINRSTFYKYYGNQFDLLSEMEEDLIEGIETMLTSQESYNEDAIEQIFTYLEKDIEFIRLLLNSNVDPQFPERIFSLGQVRQIIGAQKTDMTEEEYEYYYRFFLHGAYEMVHMWINKENREPAAWIAALIYKFFLP